MGSTTKIWTFDLAAQALADHFVSVNDLVTINADEASHKPPNESSMTDLNGKPLEKGEVVKFGDLIRGMMYPSGNNAAYAIADHLARTYYGPRSEEHTSELQSRRDLVCRLLLEKKKKKSSHFVLHKTKKTRIPI